MKWFGTWYYGVSSFDGTTWETFTTTDGLAYNDVFAIAVDNDNIKWFGTWGGGVSSFGDRKVTVESYQDMPFVMEIQGNYPNPFNPSTTIEFTVPEPGFADLIIYNISGQKVRELISDTMSAETHSIMWNGCDDNGIPVSSGVYISQLKTGNFSSAHKMMLYK